MSSVPNHSPAMKRYVTLGRSGLRVSPISLGTMTFGTETGWGSDQKTARALFDQYLAAGGNFIDTSEAYTGGTSERWLGEFIKSAGNRDQVVLASKYTVNVAPGNPNAGGNGRKNLMRALESSLERLQTDYIDLYYVHVWDRFTPAEEVMRAMDDAVRDGKIRHVGLSDTPAWYAGRAQTIAEWRGFAPVAAMQVEQSLIERNAELEFADVAVETGMGLVAWSPLGMGLLSGKYKPDTAGPDAKFGEGRLQTTSAAGNAPAAFDKFTERNFAIVAELEKVAAEAGASMAQTALNWLHGKRGMASIIVGATQPEQLADSMTALDFELTPAQRARLDAVSEPARPFPYHFFQDPMQRRITGGVEVASQSAGYARPVLISPPPAA